MVLRKSKNVFLLFFFSFPVEGCATYLTFLGLGFPMFTYDVENPSM